LRQRENALRYPVYGPGHRPLWLLKHHDGFDLPFAALWFPLVPAGIRLSLNWGIAVLLLSHWADVQCRPQWQPGIARRTALHGDWPRVNGLTYGQGVDRLARLWV